MNRSLAFLVRSKGRLAGALVLVLMLALQAAWPLLFAGPRLALFDFYMRLLPRHRVSAPVVIVAVDEPSLARVGQWPWPRHKLASLIDRILAGHPTALGLDLLLPEADRSSPATWEREEGTLPAPLADALAALPDHDAILAEAIRRGPVVLGVAGRRDRLPDAPGPRTATVSHGGDPLPRLPPYDGLLRSLPALDAMAAGHGMLSVDKSADGLVRRMPMLSAVRSDYALPSLTLEMLRLAAGAASVDIDMDAAGIRDVALNGFVVPTEPDGFVWLHLSPHDEGRFVSAADVLAGTVPASRFEQRWVLLGVTGLALADQNQTALGPMAGVELNAQLLENVFDRQLAARPRWAHQAELGLAAVLGGLLVIGLPWLRLRWYPLAAVLTLALLAAAGLGAWQYKTWLIDVAGPGLADGAAFIALLGGTLADVNAQRRRLRRDLEAQRLSEAKMAGELDAARRIQMGILPKAESLPADPRFELHAAIEPARQVGGDLYDFFKIDDDHLFVMIGDVSGKGVPASLFMALGKALYKSCVLRGGRDIGTIMSTANTEIARDNVEMLFITAFAGILDLDKGELAFCNAGHDPPFLVRPGAASTRIESEGGGPPLCVIDDFPYLTERRRLEPRDILVLATDGVMEAMDATGALMGPARAAAALAAMPSDASATDAVDTVRAAVSLFVGDAEQSDDLTLVALRWHGAKIPPP